MYAFPVEKRTIVEELVEEIPGGRPVLKWAPTYSNTQTPKHSNTFYINGNKWG